MNSSSGAGFSDMMEIGPELAGAFFSGLAPVPVVGGASLGVYFLTRVRRLFAYSLSIFPRSLTKEATWVSKKSIPELESML